MSFPKLLVVEDDKNDLELLLMVLREGDFDVNIAVRGDDAKRMLQQGEYDTVLLNLSLPDMDGLELVRWCQERWPSMPVQIVTGHYDIETKMKAFQAGACYFWQKPYEAVANMAILKMLQIKRLAFQAGQAASSPKTTTWGMITGLGLLTFGGGYFCAEQLEHVFSSFSVIVKGLGLFMAAVGAPLLGRHAQDQKRRL